MLYTSRGYRYLEILSQIHSMKFKPQIMMFTCRTVNLFVCVLGLSYRVFCLSCGLVSIEDYLAIEFDELINDGSACVEVIPKYSLK
jgi:hypothetical protein